MKFNEQYGIYLAAFESVLSRRCKMMRFQPPVLAESMRYSLLAGGKRIRPVLFYAMLDTLGCDYLRESDFAVALECIHTYSLIHDDLPAMDNDDFRRGKPSNHRVFGEANAILAGDALLSYALELVVNEAAKGDRYARAARILARAAGPEGMVAGQSADLFYEKRGGGEKELSFIYRNKTGRLLQAPLQMAAILAERCEEEVIAFGEDFGYLFQLTDDLLDVKGNSSAVGKTLGKDAREGKLTCVKVFGKEKSECLANECAQSCKEHIVSFGGGAFFEGLVDFVRNRNH